MQLLVAGNDPSPCNWPTTGSEEIDVEDNTTQDFTHLRTSIFTNSATGGTYCDPGTTFKGGDGLTHVCQ